MAHNSSQVTFNTTGLRLMSHISFLDWPGWILLVTPASALLLGSLLFMLALWQRRREHRVMQQNLRCREERMKTFVSFFKDKSNGSALESICRQPDQKGPMDDAVSYENVGAGQVVDSKMNLPEEEDYLIPDEEEIIEKMETSCQLRVNDYVNPDDKEDETKNSEMMSAEPEQEGLASHTEMDAESYENMSNGAPYRTSGDSGEEKEQEEDAQSYENMEGHLPSGDTCQFSGAAEWEREAGRFCDDADPSVYAIPQNCSTPLRTLSGANMEDDNDSYENMEAADLATAAVVQADSWMWGSNNSGHYQNFSIKGHLQQGALCPALDIKEDRKTVEEQES
ncbi:uncharacterized protein LOC120536416 isoform X1 [Polypterus senegalus]|uniref:uncharacterized protein LOC120536416 isoform X1 n=1 Tax=Polypterus senegalus TaxID=55291 RepID=UPI001966BDCB|nr:uncharacterized protein LOC120536416 isoform X1 [Polypterus senegalus]XP_039620684.1 uncharacterized protein LOC120536416 isoform X1 [Polypterus senegalus]